MLFKLKTVATIATTAVVVLLLFNPAVSDEAVFASPPDVLVLNEADVEVGQVIGTGVMEDDACVMNHEVIVVEVDISTDEPSAGITLGVNENCALFVVDKRRTFESVGPVGGMFGASSGVDPRHRAFTKSEWSDLGQLDVAAVYIRYTYDEEDDGFSFVGSPREQCVKAGWWRTFSCRVYSKSEGSSSIKATGYGDFGFQVTGRYRHQQKATMTAKANGNGTARCWSSTNLSHLRFHYEGDIDRIN